MKKALIPLGVFAVLVVFLAIGLTRDPSVVPSPLINKPAPTFVAPQLMVPDKQFAAKDMLGKVWLLNVWASWCVACLQEHPVLMEFAKTKIVTLVGLDYKDVPADGLKWLARHGDPYDVTITDRDGRIGIDFGVYGVPETFLIDKAGMIRHKHIGPVTDEALRDTIVPLIRELQK
jgi:cytochrome c biogenesis protein CcmG/thiol:disulfide interchange protein DsbE